MPNADKLKGCMFPDASAPKEGYEANPMLHKVYAATPELVLSVYGPTIEIARERWNRINYRPTPSAPGDDVVEAMAKAAFRIPGEAYMLSTEGDTIRRAISAAEAMGYVFTKQEPS